MLDVSFPDGYQQKTNASREGVVATTVRKVITMITGQYGITNPSS